MGRPLRFIPPNALVEVTCRTIHGRFLLRPSRDLNAIVLGILGRAAGRYRVKVCAFVFLSNHAHLLLQPKNAEQLALFMGYVNGNLAKEAGRLHRWRERFWSRRYRAIVVSDDEVDQVERLRYILCQGCKEGLVRRPQDWPGASSVEALLDGSEIRGLWFDRSHEYEARRRGERPGKYAFAEEERFRLAPLPAWEGLSGGERRDGVRRLIAEIEAEIRRTLAKAGRSVLGKRRILRQDPHDRPAQSQRSPAPRFHAQRWEIRKCLELTYYAFRVAYRQAADDLRRGLENVEFPVGCFPPRLPFNRGHPIAAEA